MEKKIYSFDLSNDYWKIYHATYDIDREDSILLESPSSVNLSSFTNNQLRTISLLDSKMEKIIAVGEQAYHRFQNVPDIRSRIVNNIEFNFGDSSQIKNCRHLLNFLLKQLLSQQIGGLSFDKDCVFIFAYPISSASKKNQKDFQAVIKECLKDLQITAETQIIHRSDAILMAQIENGRKFKSNENVLILDIGNKYLNLTFGQVDTNSKNLHPDYKISENYPIGEFLYEKAIGKEIISQLEISSDEIEQSDLAKSELIDKARLFITEICEIFEKSIEKNQVELNISIKTEKDIYMDLVSVDKKTFSDSVKEIDGEFCGVITKFLQKNRIPVRDTESVVIAGNGAHIFSLTEEIKKQFQNKKIYLFNNPHETIVEGLIFAYKNEKGVTQVGKERIYSGDDFRKKNKGSSKDDKFRILFLGESNSGKTTFVNSLIKSDILPASPLNDTSVFVELRYGSEQSAKIISSNKLNDDEGKKINMEQIVDCIKKNNKTANQLNPYNRIIVSGNFEICQNRIILVDTPDYESSCDLDLFNDYLKTSDILLFFISCENLFLSNSMRKAIDSARDNDQKAIVFVCNFFDRLRKHDKRKVRDFAYTQLGHFNNLFHDNYIFFISAIDALEGIKRGDIKKLESSGIDELLSAFQEIIPTQYKFDKKIFNL